MSERMSAPIRRIPPLPTSELKKQFPSELKSWLGMMKRVRSGEAQCADEFRDFRTFLRELGPKPDASYTLDRVVRRGLYSPQNVRWATKRQQANNRGNTRFLTYDGTKLPDHVGSILPLTEWARLTNQPAGTLHRRLADGWTETETIDGKRAEADLSFDRMSLEQLLNYKPWPEETREEDEREYLRKRTKGESRFQFERRVLIPRWQNKIDSDAPDTMRRRASLTEDERDGWEIETTLYESGWYLSGQGDEADLTRIARRQRRLDRYVRENIAEARRWAAALEKYHDRKLQAKAANELREKHLAPKKARKRQALDPELEPFDFRPDKEDDDEDE